MVLFFIVRFYSYARARALQEYIVDWTSLVLGVYLVSRFCTPNSVHNLCSLHKLPDLVYHSFNTTVTLSARLGNAQPWRFFYAYRMA